MGNKDSQPHHAPPHVGSGGGNQPPKTSTQAALQQIHAQIDNITKRRDFLQKKADAEQQLAKTKVKAGNKNGAMLHLKKKAALEKQVQQLDAQMLNLEKTVSAIEATATNAETVNAMRVAQQTQAQLMKNVDADHVDDLMMNLQEQNDEAERVSEMLGQSMDPLADAGVEDELNALQDEVASEELEEKPMPAAIKLPVVPKTEPASKLPVAPKHVPQVEEEDEDARALRELEAELA